MSQQQFQAEVMDQLRKFQAEVMDQLGMQKEWDAAFPSLTGSALEAEINKMWEASDARTKEFKEFMK